MRECLHATPTSTAVSVSIPLSFVHKNRNWRDANVHEQETRVLKLRTCRKPRFALVAWRLVMTYSRPSSSLGYHPLQIYIEHMVFAL